MIVIVNVVECIYLGSVVDMIGVVLGVGVFLFYLFFLVFLRIIVYFCEFF